MQTITLEGRPFDVKPLTLGQIEDLSVAVVLPPTGDPQQDVRRNFQRSIDVIVTGLNDPAMDAAKLRSMAITRDELDVAAATILELSGLIKRKTAPGEAAAAAAG